MDNIPYPVRINRYLALVGETTRRGADALIEQKQVLLNGRPAVLGDVVKRGDTVEVKQTAPRPTYVYFAYHKPRGIITHSPDKGEQSVQDAVRGKIRERVFPIGRLDKDSRGLLILTNDGRITEKLLSPKKEHEKEYSVTVDKPITERFLKHLHKGVNIEEYVTKPARATRTGEQKFSIVLTEGKKHQIRRMCAAEGYVVRDIKRTRIMNIKLGSLVAGDTRPLQGKELATFLDSLK